MVVAGPFLRTSERPCPSYSDHIRRASVALSVFGRALAFLPFLIDGRRKLAHLREKCGQFPKLIVTEIISPAGHPRKSDSMLNDVEVLVLGHVGRIFHEPRHGRIEGAAHDWLGVTWIAVTIRAIGFVKLHGFKQIRIRRRDWIFYDGRMAFCRGVQSLHGVFLFETGRGLVGTKAEEAKRKEDVRPHCNKQHSNDAPAQKELHRSLLLTVLVSLHDESATRTAMLRWDQDRQLFWQGNSQS